MFLFYKYYFSKRFLFQKYAMHVYCIQRNTKEMQTRYPDIIALPDELGNGVVLTGHSRNT
jgi:hypothetical protein